MAVLNASDYFFHLGKDPSALGATFDSKVGFAETILGCFLTTGKGRSVEISSLLTLRYLAVSNAFLLF